MSKKNLLGALVMMLGLNLGNGNANAYHCTCWDHSGANWRCLGRVHPFGGDLVACGNACKHYAGRTVRPYIDGDSLLKCNEQNAPILGPW